MNAMEIRPLTSASDRMAVGRVYEESWKYAYRGILPQAYLDGIPAGCWAERAERFPALLLWDGDRIAGVSSYCASRFPAWPDWGGGGLFVSPYLLPPYLGRGYGTRLLQAAEERLEAMGLQRQFLWVLEENGRARRFYEKNGWTQSKEALEDVIGGQTVREVRYCRRRKEAAGGCG